MRMSDVAWKDLTPCFLCCGIYSSALFAELWCDSGFTNPGEVAETECLR